jgi:hypothetical protein
MTASHADFTVVRDGKAAATIVIAADAGEKVKIAANDLQTYLAKMSGAKLPLVADDPSPTGALVLVGASKLTASLSVKIPVGVTPARREEGFVIWCRGDRLVLAGNNDGPYHGTEYAVYDFLNRLGVRWFMPGEFGEVVPRQTTITCAEVQDSQQPDFLMRNWWLHIKPEIAEQETRWKIRNKMNPDVADFFAVPGDSSIRNVLDSQLVKAKPELFGLRQDGTRDEFYPNLTNPDTVQMVAGKIKEWFRSNPGATSYGFAPDDGMPRDFNPETMKLNLGLAEVLGRPGVPAEASVSGEWFTFVGQVIDEVHQEFPDVYIATNGYANRDLPPQGVPINPKMVLMFAAIWSCTLHGYDADNCWQKVRQGQMLQQWAKLCPNVWIYGYDYNMLVSGLTLLPEFTKLRRDLPLLKKWGVIGFYDEYRNQWAEAGIGSRYLRARLEWDADTKVDAYLDDFFQKWYGPAGKTMQAYYYALDKAIADNPVHGHEDRCLPELYTSELTGRMRRELTSAERAATAEPYLTRVKAERLIFDHLRAYAAMNQADLSGDFAQAATKAGEMLALRPQLHQISPFFIWPDEDGYHTGVWYWKIIDRQKFYQDLADKMNGAKGDPVGLCGQTAAFQLDPHDAGAVAGWYQPAWPTADWKTVATNRPFFAQGYRDPQGHPYVGNMWYRLQVDVPARFAGRKVRLCAPQVVTEGWCWVNGKFVGYRPYMEAYTRPIHMDVDVSAAVKPGRNDVVFRVNTSLAEAQDAEGLYCRVFLYAPK